MKRMTKVRADLEKLRPVEETDVRLHGLHVVISGSGGASIPLDQTEFIGCFHKANDSSLSSIFSVNSSTGHPEIRQCLMPTFASHLHLKTRQPPTAFPNLPPTLIGVCPLLLLLLFFEVCILTRTLSNLFILLWHCPRRRNKGSLFLLNLPVTVPIQCQATTG